MLLQCMGISRKKIIETIADKKSMICLKNNNFQPKVKDSIQNINKIIIKSRKIENFIRFKTNDNLKKPSDYINSLRKFLFRKH